MVIDPVAASHPRLYSTEISSSGSDHYRASQYVDLHNVNVSETREASGRLRHSEANLLSDDCATMGTH